METPRRSFLKVGPLAALALAAGGGTWHAVQASTPQRFALDGEARAALEAIIPAIMAGALPPERTQRSAAIAATTLGVHQAILGLPLATQKEIQDLFGLLALGPARRVLTGIADGWARASVDQVSAFLQDWRLSRVALLRTAYQALHDLVLGAWYASPGNWEAIGYPGPIKELA
jgi:hypothetical protein